MGISVNDCVPAHDDLVKSEKAISLDAETADERTIYATAILEVKEVEFAELGLLRDGDVLADVSAKHTEVQNFKRRVHGEDTTARGPQTLVDNPPTQMVNRPARNVVRRVMRNG